MPLDMAPEYMKKPKHSNVPSPEANFIFENIKSGEPSTSYSFEDNPQAGDESFPFPAMNNRRHAIFAEQYNPEEEDDYDDFFSQFPAKDEQEKSRLRNKIQNAVLLQNLTKEQSEMTLNAFIMKPVAAGEIIMRQGDDGEFYFVIDRGLFHMYLEDSEGVRTLIGRLDNAGLIGELSLLYIQPYAMTIEAVTEGAIWALDRTTFRKCTSRIAYRRRNLYKQFLRSVDLFDSLSANEIDKLSDGLNVEEYNDAEVVIQQGDKADGMYFVEEGEVVIKRIVDEKEIEVCRLGDGQYFGELAFLNYEKRASSAFAVGQTRLVFLEVSTFQRLFGSYIEILLHNLQQYDAKMAEIASIAQIM